MIATSNITCQKSAGTRQFLGFGQGKSLFGVELRVVREVLGLKNQPIAPIPNTLPFILGLTNLRGEILAIADFGRLIGSEPVERNQIKSSILVIESPNPIDVKLPLIRMGLAISFVEGVFSLDPEQIVSSAEVSEDLAAILRGLYDYQGRLLMIVDVEAIAQSKRW